MKKIKNIELSSLIFIITITMTFGINMHILISNTSMNSLITLILSYIIGTISIIMYLYISNYLPNLSIIEKIKNLYKHPLIINTILCLIFLIIALTINYTINNFVTSQFLYRTPIYLTSITYIFLIVYNVSKGINTISHISFLMTITNLIFFIISFTSITRHINIDNFLPILKENTNNIPLTAIKVASINTLPILLLLIIPKNNLDNPKKYNKTVIYSYIFASTISILILFATVGTLGIYLSKTYEYPEYIVLKKVSILGFLERIENIVANQWVVSTFIYISLILYYISQNIKTSSKKKYPIIGISFYIIANLIFKNNTIFSYFTSNIFPYICMSIILIYLQIIVKILLKKKKI